MTQWYLVRIVILISLIAAVLAKNTEKTIAFGVLYLGATIDHAVERMNK